MVKTHLAKVLLLRLSISLAKKNSAFQEFSGVVLIKTLYEDLLLFQNQSRG